VRLDKLRNGRRISVVNVDVGSCSSECSNEGFPKCSLDQVLLERIKSAFVKGYCKQWQIELILLGRTSVLYQTRNPSWLGWLMRWNVWNGRTVAMYF
jgi:hypothetical protein